MHPSDTVYDALHCLAQRIELPNLEGWALYEVNTNTEAEKYIRGHQYIADFLAAWELEAKEAANEKDNSIYGTAIRYGTLGAINKTGSTKVADLQISYKFLLKRRLFKNVRQISKNPVEINLMFWQAVNSVVKKDEFPVSERIALQLAGLLAQVKLGEWTAERSMQHYNDVYNYLCKRILSKKQPNGQPKINWAAQIAEAHRKHGTGKTQLISKVWFLSVCMQYPSYGSSLFSVVYRGYHEIKAGQHRYLLGVSSEGVLLMNSEKMILQVYRYTDIESVSVLSTQMNQENLITFKFTEEFMARQNEKGFLYLTFESAQKDEIAQLIYAYAPNLNHANSLGSRKSNGLMLNASNADKAPPVSTGINRRLLKMTLEDRMKFHQELMNCRKGLVESGSLRKPEGSQTPESVSFMRSTLRRLKHNKLDKMKREVGFAADFEDECFALYPHAYWAYSRYPLSSSILVTADPEIERTALQNFKDILRFSGLLGANQQNGLDSSQSSPASSTNSSSTHLTGSPIINGMANGQTIIQQQSANSSSSGSPVLNTLASEMSQIQLAQIIMNRAMHKNASDIFRNELFLQLIKQTTDNPEPNSRVNIKHWQLLSLACSVTYPKDRRIMALLNAHLRK